MATLTELKEAILEERVQFATVDRDGKLLESCDSVVALAPYVGSSIFESFPMFLGLEEEILGLRADSAAFTLPLVAFEGAEGSIDLEFRASEDDLLLWILSSNGASTERTRVSQQERNEASILLERMRREDQQLRADNAALEASNGGLNRFACEVAHDLKAPLRGITHLATWIEEAAEDGRLDELPEYLALMRSRADRLQALVDGMLSFALADHEGGDVVEVDVHGLLLDIIESDFAESGVEFVVPARLPTISTEPMGLRQVLLNLLGNAAKHGRSTGGVVTVTWSGNLACPCIHVSDNGPGIGPQDRQRIFKAFERLPATSASGVGLGLSIVKRLVDLVGGEIKVTDAEPGRRNSGATFSFTWPASTETLAHRI